MVAQPKKAPGKAAGESEKPAKPLAKAVSAPKPVNNSVATEAPTKTFPGNDVSSSGSFAKPDQASYNNSQAELRTKIDELTLQVVGHTFSYLGLNGLELWTPISCRTLSSPKLISLARMVPTRSDGRH